MVLYFSALAFILAKSTIVPGNIGCFHVCKVDINPEIDKGKLVNETGHRYLYLWIYVKLFTVLVAMFDHYLSGEMLRCLLSNPHRSFEYCLFSAPLILPILWREQRAQGSPFPPNIIIWSGLICTAMYCKRETRH